MVKLLTRLRNLYPKAEIQISWMPGGDTTTIYIDEGNGSWLAGKSHTLIGALHQAIGRAEDVPF